MDLQIFRKNWESGPFKKLMEETFYFSKDAIMYQETENFEEKFFNNITTLQRQDILGKSKLTIQSPKTTGGQECAFL